MPARVLGRALELPRHSSAFQRDSDVNNITSRLLCAFPILLILRGKRDEKLVKAEHSYASKYSKG